MAICRSNLSNELVMGGVAWLMLLLALSSTSPISARILDEDQPPLAPIAQPPETSDPDELAPVPVTTTTAPTASVAQPISGDASSSVATPDPHHPLTFFMHDILGGTHPSARVVTGIVSNTAVNGQFPFAKPSNGAVFPVNGAVPLPNGNNVNINNNNNNMPFLTGPGGQTTSVGGNINGNNNNIIGGGNRLPFVNAGQLPAGSTIQNLFGTLTVIDDELSEGHELGSAVVGKAQGFYVASSEDGSSQSMVFTALLESGHYLDSISFFGVHRTVSEESQIAVIGGTGQYANAKGYATVKSLHQVEQHTTDGVESLLQLTVHLSY